MLFLTTKERDASIGYLANANSLTNSQTLYGNTLKDDIIFCNSYMRTYRMS